MDESSPEVIVVSTKTAKEEPKLAETTPIAVEKKRLRDMFEDIINDCYTNGYPKKRYYYMRPFYQKFGYFPPIAPTVYAKVTRFFKVLKGNELPPLWVRQSKDLHEKTLAVVENFKTRARVKKYTPNELRNYMPNEVDYKVNTLDELRKMVKTIHQEDMETCEISQPPDQKCNLSAMEDETIHQAYNKQTELHPHWTYQRKDLSEKTLTVVDGYKTNKNSSEELRKMIEAILQGTNELNKPPKCTHPKNVYDETIQKTYDKVIKQEEEAGMDEEVLNEKDRIIQDLREYNDRLIFTSQIAHNFAKKQGEKVVEMRTRIAELETEVKLYKIGLSTVQEFVGQLMKFQEKYASLLHRLPS